MDEAKYWGHNNIAKLITSYKAQPRGELSVTVYQICVLYSILNLIWRIWFGENHQSNDHLSFDEA